MPTTLATALRKNAKATPDRTALTFILNGERSQLTTAQLLAGAEDAATKLAARGVAGGDLVILVLQHSLELVYAFWGCVLLGAVPSIFPFLTEKLDPELYRQRIKTLVEHSEAKAVVTYSDNLAPLTKLIFRDQLAIIDLSNLQPSAVPRTLNIGSGTSDSIALLQHSSGSTGLQKGVALSHRAVLRQIEAYGKAIGLDPTEDVIVSWLPLYHDMGLIAGFVMPVVTGTHLVLMSPFEWVRQPGMLLDAISHYKGSLCWLPNFAYNLLARTLRPKDGLDLSSLRAVINCSEPAYDESHQLFVEKMAPHDFRRDALAVSYAMAENTFAVTQTAIGTPPRVDTVEIGAIQERGEAKPIAFSNGQGKRFVSCGAPIDTVELRILDTERNPLPDRRVGEIALRSEFMLSEYYKRPDLTAAAITPDGWYVTGDMGYMADGELYITGRKKDLIIVGGKNIYPQDIEASANRTPGIHPGRAVAFGVLDDRIGSEKVIVVAELAEGGNADEAERSLRATIVQETEVTLGDLRFVPRGWIVKTSSGKHARTDNREKYLREFAGK
jgi:fatty-acyl-CoA synthase